MRDITTSFKGFHCHNSNIYCNLISPSVFDQLKPVLILFVKMPLYLCPYHCHTLNYFYPVKCGYLTQATNWISIIRSSAIFFLSQWLRFTATDFNILWNPRKEVKSRSLRELFFFSLQFLWSYFSHPVLGTVPGNHCLWAPSTLIKYSTPSWI